MKKIKKLLMFLCILILFFGISGCKKDAAQPTTIATPKPGAPPPPAPPPPAPVPEPATIILLGSGLVGLAAFARNKFKK